MKAILLKFLLAGVLTITLAGTASANLNVRGTGTIVGGGTYQLIYDSAQDITWLDFTSQQKTWVNQMSWASNLQVTFNGETFSDWRLPSTDDSLVKQGGGQGWSGPGGDGRYGYEWGYNMYNSELSHLFYITLGNLGYRDTNGNIPPEYGLLNDGPFSNLGSHIYWSSSSVTWDSNHAWYMSTSQGQLFHTSKTTHYYGIAVMQGDIAAVPVPAAVWLLGSGLAGLIGVGRKIRK